MIHDPELLDYLTDLPEVRFDGSVFRATALSADPKALSFRGGRWAPPHDAEGGFPVLYTSLDRQGALAEVAAYLLELSPIPRKPLKVTELVVSTSKTMRLVRADLEHLGIDMRRFAERSYEQTQRLGAAINFLGLHGFVAPSARWDGDNLIICGGNYDVEKISDKGSDEIPWELWHRIFDAPR